MIQIIDAICWWFIAIVAYVVQFVGVAAILMAGFYGLYRVLDWAIGW